MIESWSRADLQRLTGLSRAPIDKLLAAGLPHTKVAGKGREFRIEPGPALRWLVEHVRPNDDETAPDLSAARARLAVTQEELTRLRLDKERGELVPAAEVRKVREAENLMVRDRMRSIPQSVAERVLDAAAKGARGPEVAELLLAEVDAALVEIAEAEVIIVPAEATP
jgi:phage terminase Nu1 subunit (DNA packaging protein)